MKENSNFEPNSLKLLIKNIKELSGFLKNKKKHIVTTTIFSIVFGACISFYTPIKYISKLSFVVEEGKGSSGGLAALAGQFGFDLGAATGSGVFSGDNILIFLKSESLCRQTLLTPYDSVRKQTLADKYAEITGLKKKWQKKSKIGDIFFGGYDKDKLPRLHDSLLQNITLQILKNDLSVSKPDKKATFIQIKTEMGDEMLSLLFTRRLVQIATDRYIDSKTKYKLINVENLQKRADSLGFLLNSKTYETAISQQKLVDINPAMRVAPISLEITSREKMMISAVFSEVVKNLEISKTILSQETPVIQIVDESSLPLPRVHNSLFFSSFLYGALGFFFSVFYFLIKSWVGTFF